jgi:hypothetical protein
LLPDGTLETEELFIIGCVSQEDTEVHTNSAELLLEEPSTTEELRFVDVVHTLIKCTEIELTETDGLVVQVKNLCTSSKDVGETDKLKLSYLEEDGIVSELTEEDTDLQLVSVTESPVLTLYSSEDKVTTVDVETIELPSPRETEDITDNIHNTGTVN